MFRSLLRLPTQMGGSITSKATIGSRLTVSPILTATRYATMVRTPISFQFMKPPSMTTSPLGVTAPVPVSKPVQVKFTPSPAVLKEIQEFVDSLNVEQIWADSVLRKRRLKMKKHKLRKRRRAQRSLMKRLGKL